MTTIVSRAYLNQRWCVRCGKSSPTPYLKQATAKYLGDLRGKLCLDAGCGNKRNTKFMVRRGASIIAVDMADDCETKCVLGVDTLPVKDGCVDILLANYVLMFLNRNERYQCLRELCRVAGDTCYLIVELYPAKDSYAKTDKDCSAMLEQIVGYLERRGWTVGHRAKHKCIMMKVTNEDTHTE